MKWDKTDKTVLTSCDCKTSPCCSEGPAARLWEPPGRKSVGRSDRKEENGIEKGHWTKKTRAKSPWGETLILNNFEAECGLRWWSLSFTKPFVLWFFHIYSLDFPCYIGDSLWTQWPSDDTEVQSLQLSLQQRLGDSAEELSQLLQVRTAVVTVTFSNLLHSVFVFFALKFHLIYLNIFDIFDFIVSEWLESFGLGSLLNSGGATSHLRGDGKNGTNMTEQNTQIIQSQNSVQIRWDKQKTWGDGNGRRLISLMVGLCQLNALKTLKHQF